MVEKSMQKSKIKVVDDFLPIFEFAPIKNQMEGGEFPWYWQEHSHGNFSDGKFKGDNVPQLIHGFVEDGNASSHYYYFFKHIPLFLLITLISLCNSIYYCYKPTSVINF